jgi:hypothetical protein
MINQSAIDGGFFSFVFFRTYNDRESEKERIRKPNLK